MDMRGSMSVSRSSAGPHLRRLRHSLRLRPGGSLSLSLRGRGPIEHGIRAIEAALLLLLSLLLRLLASAACELAVRLTRGMRVLAKVCARGEGMGKTIGVS